MPAMNSDVTGKNALIMGSMSRKGNPWDNAVAESFFKSLKDECDISISLQINSRQH